MSHHAISHMIVSALIHGVIYAAVWHVMRSLPLTDDIVIAVAAIGVGWLFSARRQPRPWQ
jgi:hypothetical protein